MTGILLAFLLAFLPQCAEEDGSTQEICVWDGRNQGNGTGAIVINVDHGKQFLRFK